MDPVVRRRWTVRAGYGLLATVSFVYFLFLGFPFERVVKRQLAAAEKGSGFRVETGSIRAGWDFSLVATDVRIFPAARRRGGESDTPEEPALRIERIALRPSVWQLLTLKPGARVHARVYGGRVEGTVAQSGGRSLVSLDVKEVELAKYAPLSERFQLHASGRIGGTVELDLDAADATKSTGKIDLAVQGARIDESNPYNLQKIPKTEFERGGTAVVEIGNGKATLKDVGFHGEELDLSLEGEILLRKSFASSQWAAKASIRASDAWKAQVALLDTFLGPGKGGDGTYRYKLAGPVSRPRPVPDRSR